MFLKAAINGGRTTAEHPRTPVTLDDIAEDTRRVLGAGADVVHVHARRPDGSQTIAPDDVAAMVSAVHRAAPDAIVGTTTGLWTCDGHAARMEAIRGWTTCPDFASVAFCEEGAAEAASLVVEKGMVLESAIWSLDDLPALLASPTLHQNVRILIEPFVEDAEEAVSVCREAAARLAEAGVRCPLLYHGEGATVWPVLRAAVEDGAQARIGFEDGLELPDGTQASDNVSLVQAALAQAALLDPV